ncbi:PQQ-binding-like beta-propeller repeat protein [Halorarius litoreus]|uniref:outer membrane protein assembly factor BamB family protein n=1 Tax=Halorarius litoreus TaxID=2962676 RepID=UPI0020CD1992|nr:PQQ-binding-like beta-propeller repeat protein [Halorarius litoreus]
MRRRRFLAAFGTAASVGLAGCGYAPGGGDSHGTARVDPGGLGSEPMWAVGAAGIVGARSGRITVFEGEGVEFTEGTELRRATRAGTDRWWHTYRTESTAVALGDAVYLLDVEGRVVAFAGREREDEDGRVTVEGTRLWRTGVEGVRAPLVAAGSVAYVATDTGVAAVRDGTVQWRVSLSAPPETLLPTDGGVLAAAGETVVSLANDGAERWRTAGEGPLAATAERVYVQTPDGALAALDRRGRRLWTADASFGLSSIATTADAVYAVGTSGLTAFDADGTERWRVGRTLATRTAVPAPEGAYLAGRGTVEALGPEGRRWERDLETDSSEPVAGWLDGQRVALLFDAGTIYWFQRTDQREGLLSGHR